MREKISILLIVFSFAVLQLTVFSNFFWGVGPNLLLLLVLFWTIQDGFNESLGRNIFSGCFFDLVVFSPIGVHVMTFSLVAFFVSFVSKRFLVEARNWRVLILGIIVVFSVVANNFFLNAMFSVFKFLTGNILFEAPAPTWSLAMLRSIFVNLLFSPLVYFLLKRFKRYGILQASKRVF